MSSHCEKLCNHHHTKQKMPPQSDQLLLVVQTSSFHDDVDDDHDDEVDSVELITGIEKEDACCDASTSSMSVGDDTGTIAANGQSVGPRRVQFAPQNELCQIQEILDKKDYSTTEKEAVWLTKYDWMRIEEDIRNDMMLASWKNRRRQPHEIDPARGIEWKTHEGSQRRLKYHQKSSGAVLAEQRRQRVSGGKVTDEEHLAFVYKSMCSICQQTALSTASKDEQSVVQDPEYPAFKESIMRNTLSSNT